MISDAILSPKPRMNYRSQLLILLLSLLVGGSTASAKSIRRIDLVETLEQSDRVMIGRVREEHGDSILMVSEVLKGEAASEIKLASPGIDNHLLVVLEEEWPMVECPRRLHALDGLK